LETGSKIGHFAQGELLVSSTTTHLTDNDQTRVYPQSYSQGEPFCWLQTDIEGFYRL
jgi:hypothetical protein